MVCETELAEWPRGGPDAGAARYELGQVSRRPSVCRYNRRVRNPPRSPARGVGTFRAQRARGIFTSSRTLGAVVRVMRLARTTPLNWCLCYMQTMGNRTQTYRARISVSGAERNGRGGGADSLTRRPEVDTMTGAGGALYKRQLMRRGAAEAAGVGWRASRVAGSTVRTVRAARRRRHLRGKRVLFRARTWQTRRAWGPR
ncbi:unnamed protein product, partial [Iphiclides podalirius]